MKIYIKDTLDFTWAYDTEQRRFYLDDPEVEKELGMENGYVTQPRNLRSLLIGSNSVAPFLRPNVMDFIKILKAVSK